MVMHADDTELARLARGSADAATAEHVNACEICRDRLQLMAALAAISRAEIATMPPPRVWQAVVTRLPDRTQRGWRWLPLAALAASGCIVVLVGLWSGADETNVAASAATTPASVPPLVTIGRGAPRVITFERQADLLFIDSMLERLDALERDADGDSNWRRTRAHLLRARQRIAEAGDPPIVI